MKEQAAVFDNFLLFAQFFTFDVYLTDVPQVKMTFVYWDKKKNNFQTIVKRIDISSVIY